MRPRTTALLAVALLVLVATPAGGMPPPEQVCGACGGAFEDAAADHGVGLDVAESTATVAVHENGSATWTVRNAVSPSSADRLRANDTAARVAADLVDTDDLLAVDVADDGAVTIRYRVDDFAVRSVGGAMRVEFFREDFAVANYDSLGADRLTLVAPDGMRVGRALPSASVDGREMTLTSYEPGTDSAFVTLVPRGALFGALLSLLAVAEVLAPVVARNVVRDVLPPLVVFGVGVAVDVAVLSRVGPRPAAVRRYATPALLALGALAVVATLAGSVLPVLGGASPPVFGAGVGLLALGGALSRLERSGPVSYRAQTLAALGAVVVALVADLAAAALFVGGRRPALPLFLLAPLFGLLPAGAALGRENRRLAVATAFVAFLAGVLAVVPLARRPMGVSGLFVVSGGLYAVALVALGWPLLLVGASLATESSPGDGT